MSVRGINQVLKVISSSIKQNPSRFSIVSGNQSGGEYKRKVPFWNNSILTHYQDLDSIVSAISYAYFNHIHNSSSLMIPLLNFTRKELSSRKDVLLVFQKHGIDTQNLFFTDDLTQLKNVDQLILVDHNSPQGKVKNLGLEIVGIIDHHEDEGIAIDAKPRIIQKSGSCSSLVFKYWYDLIGDSNKIEDSIIKFLLAPLVIDTSNLTSKVEDIDVQVFKIYSKYLHDFDTGAFYKDVRKAKDDIEGLSLDDIFLKDYKSFEFEVGSSDVVKKVGITSVVKPFDWLEDRFAKLNQGAKMFLEDQHLDIFIIMTSYLNKDDQFNRQLGIIGASESDDVLINLALEAVKDQLEIETLPKYTEESPKLQVFQQNNLASSRKQVAPAFKNALERL